MSCDCCAGIAARTPADLTNPPGRTALRYRVGTHRAFLDTMLARLSAVGFPGLDGLTTREPGDFSIALLDAWATAADVLTFYGERAVAEFFLRTATDRRSLVELARLVGYVPRPGVAASTHLAFTMEVGGDATVPAGSRVQNVPAQGQLPQSYETSAPLEGRVAFNRLRLRMSRPQQVDPAKPVSIWLRGTATGLRPGDGILIDAAGDRTFHRVQAVDTDQDANRTRIWLTARAAATPPVITPWDAVLAALRAAPVATPAQAQGPAVAGPVGLVRDTEVRLAALRDPQIAPLLYGALAAATPTGAAPAAVYALRVRARIFGHNAPLKPTYGAAGRPDDPSAWLDWDQEPTVVTGPVINVVATPPPTSAPPPARASTEVALPEDKRFLRLDRVHDGIQDGSYVVLDGLTTRIVGGPGLTARESNRTAYQLSGACTVLDFGENRSWWDGGGDRAPKMAELRATVVHTGMELLELAEEPIEDPVCGPLLELEGVHGGLAPGRLLAVSGERTDVAGVTYTEIVRVADVVHLSALSAATDRPGDRNHTVVTLGGTLRHCLVRATVTVAGNVVPATHGETKAEILGSGDATAAGQRFVLRSGPLTHVSADTPTGAVAALEVRVDDVLWPLRPTLVGLGPDDRGYALTIDDTQVATVTGPNGRWGRRFPSGAENIRARYRTGIGRPGNVDAGAITLLATKPLGVAGVVNPVPATGGADPETGEDVRRNVAVPLKAFDRLVSVPDYGDFARAFAGVGKAGADRLVVRGREEVVVTIAGADDIPIAADSQLRRNLLRALRRFGDPLVGVRVVVRERLLVRLAVTVTIDPDREWAVVEPAVRAALLATLSFERRALGQSIIGSEVLAAVHGVPGVRRCVIDTLEPDPRPTAVPSPAHPGPWLPVLPARGGPSGPLPAQLAYIAPELPEFLVLTQGGLP